jgi:hypothetical protein
MRLRGKRLKGIKKALLKVKNLCYYFCNEDLLGVIK